MTFRAASLYPEYKVSSSGKSSSDMTTSTDPSSSEQSCDTVIYVGPRDDEGTDAESPPVYLPSLNAGDQRGVMSRYASLPLHLCSKSHEYQLMPGFYEEAVLSCHRNTEALSEDKEEVVPLVVGLQARLPPLSRELPSAVSVL